MKLLAARFGAWFLEDLPRLGVPVSERRQQLVEALSWDEGRTLQAAGNALGFTREYVRQAASWAESHWTRKMKTRVEDRTATRTEATRYYRYLNANKGRRRYTCGFLGCDRETSACYNPTQDSLHCVFHRRQLISTRYDTEEGQLVVWKRLLKHIDRRDPDECWLWTGSNLIIGNCITPWTSFGKYGSRAVRRAIWTWVLGNPVPTGHWVYSPCRATRLCCNPKHIACGPPAEALTHRRKQEETAA